MRELTQEEYRLIKPLIRKTSYGLDNHSIFKSYEAAVSCSKPISLNGSPYKGRKNKGTTHIKDIAKLPDGSFALLSKTFCDDAGIRYIPDSTPPKTKTAKPEHKIDKTSARAHEKNNYPKTTGGVEIEKQNNTTNLDLNDNVIQRSQIGAASVGNVNVNIHQKSSNWLMILLLVLTGAVLYLLFR